MMEIHISVRNLVEFLLRSGDIDNTAGGRSSEDAMQAGSRIHKKIQKMGGSGYEPEVRMSVTVPFEGFSVCVEGRADGVITDKNGITIDEIKGTFRNLDFIKTPKKEHLAQAMCYAYMVLTGKQLEEISVQVTYCNLETERIKRFSNILTKEEITAWFTDLMKEYGKWAKEEVEFGRIRDESIARMTFPFPYREGQEDLTGACRSAYRENQFLFLEAPTGCGKTITTLYPAIEELGRGEIRRIFYLTAKTITRTVALDTVNILRRNALHIKSIVLTAKEKICILKTPECNPFSCVRAAGHYDRVNDAIYEIITSREELSREVIEEYAEKHRVCPFELSLDLSLFADVIICDYNYVYDPNVYLRRFFENQGGEKYLFLTDEAHNLVDRARDMYSAELCKEDMQALAEYIQGECASRKRSPIPAVYAARICKTLEDCAASFLLVKRKCDEGSYVYEDTDLFAPQLKALTRFTSAVKAYLEDDEKRGSKVRTAILDFYFEVSHFQEMWELMGDEYKLYARITEDEKLKVKLLCMDPRRMLMACHRRAKAGVLFSATLFPMEYYKDLLGGRDEDPEILAKSIFPLKNRRIFTVNDVSSRFEERTEENYEKIAGAVYRTIKVKRGNYMVFFPSFEFAEKVYRVLNKKYAPVVFDVLLQKEGMSEAEREEFLAKFRTEKKAEPVAVDTGMLKKGLAVFKRSVVGFCVLGGIFSEGIDLTGDDLIGAMIVGAGIPYITRDRELIRGYFDDKGGKGYEYAYQIPGMNKVLQAAGRVIRTDEDYGIILYLERRFLKPEYELLFPKHMKADEIITSDTVGRAVSSFWSGLKS